MVNDKIILLKTEGVSFQFLRKLTPQDNNLWWLPTEQIVAVSNVHEVNDNNGREWVQNETFLIPIHDYLNLTKPHELFKNLFMATITEQPEKFEAVET